MTESPSDPKPLIRQTFSRAAPTYDGSGRFAHFGSRLVDAARLVQGMQVLDIATGRGAVLFPAAERVGPSGRVVGIDLSEGMVEATAAEISRRGLSHVEIQCMDAEQLAFPPASFDALLCGFGIRFLPRLQHALSGFQRVLRSGGALVVSEWGQLDQRWDEVQKLRRAYSVGEGLAVNRLTKPEELEAVLGEAGFQQVEAWTDEEDFTFSSADKWLEDLWSSGPRASMERLDATTLARFKREAFERLHDLQDSNGSVPERRQAIIGTGFNP
jgi:ubiquinone/menaquinone biosynthesis C-methylase UbiE